MSNVSQFGFEFSDPKNTDNENFGESLIYHTVNRYDAWARAELIDE